MKQMSRPRYEVRVEKDVEDTASRLWWALRGCTAVRVDARDSGKSLGMTDTTGHSLPARTL